MLFVTLFPGSIPVYDSTALVGLIDSCTVPALTVVDPVELCAVKAARASRDQAVTRTRTRSTDAARRTRVRRGTVGTCRRLPTAGRSRSAAAPRSRTVLG